MINVQVGQQVAMKTGSSSEWTLVKVEKISPKGRITLTNGKVFTPDGSPYGGDRWYQGEIVEATPELLAGMAQRKQDQANIIAITNTNWRCTSSEKLARIAAILSEQ